MGMFKLFHFCLFLCLVTNVESTSPTKTPSIAEKKSIGEIIIEKHEENFGLWGQWTHCDKGKFLQGIFTANKFEISDISGEFIVSGYFCQEPERLQSSESENIRENENVAMCDGFIVGFQLKLHSIEKIGQKSIITKLKVFCTKGLIELGPISANNEGAWTEKKLCKRNEAVCGMRIMKNNPLNLDDLSRIHYGDWFECCTIEPKPKPCTPSDKWEVVFEVDNSRGLEPLKYTYTKVIGVEIEKANYEKQNENEKKTFSGNLITKYKKDLLGLKGLQPVTYVIPSHFEHSHNIYPNQQPQTEIKNIKRESLYRRPSNLVIRRKGKVFVAISLLNVNITDGAKDPNNNEHYTFNNYNDESFAQNSFNKKTLNSENRTLMEKAVKEILGKYLESSSGNVYEKSAGDKKIQNLLPVHIEGNSNVEDKEMEELSTLFKKELQNSGATGFNWAKSSSETWAPSKKTTIVIEVQPGNFITMYQVIGSCGNFKIRPEKFFQNGTTNEVQLKYVDPLKRSDGGFTKMGNILNSMSFMFQDILNAARRMTTTFHFPEESNVEVIF